MAGIKDIFGYKRNPKPEGVFSSEESLLTFGTTDLSKAIGYLVQSWNVAYQQQVQEIFEIGSSALYWMKGRPQGNGALGRIVGEKAADTPDNPQLFPREAFDLCDGGVLLVIKAKSGACGNRSGGTQFAGSFAGTQAVSLSIQLDGCVVTNIGFQVAVADTLINESVNFRFGAMAVR